MQNKRLAYLDMAKGVGIFLVVLGHIEYIEETTLRWIFSFHMPLFFVIGGFLSYKKREDSKNLPDSLKSKARGILIPYVSFSLILLTMNTLSCLLDPKFLSGEALARQYLDTATGYGVHILWFLPAYFIASASFLILIKKCRPVMSGVFVIFLAAVSGLLASLLGLDQYLNFSLSFWGYAGFDLLITFLRAFLAQPFLLAGWVLAAAEEKISQRAELSERRLCFLPGVLLVLPGAWLALKLPVFDLHYLYITPLHYLSALCTSTGLLCLTRSLPPVRPLCWMGRNSLVIMCTHATFFVVYYISLGMFFVKKWIPMTQPVFNLGVAILVCIAELPVVWIFNRYFRHLLGRAK